MRNEFGEISLEKSINWGINEFILHTLNVKEIWQYYIDLIKTHKDNFTTLNYYNCIKNHFYEYWYKNNITRNLLAFNGDITQFEQFKVFETHIKNDIEEYNN